MVFRNHIAWRFLTDVNLTMEMCGETHPGDWKKLMEHGKYEKADFDKVIKDMPQLESFMHLVSPTDAKNYYVTDTVMDKLDMLKVSKQGNHYNWMVFKNLKAQKLTLILPGNRLLRVRVSGSVVEIFWMIFKKHKDPGANIEGNMAWVMVYFNTETGELCEHFEHPDSYEIEELVYKLMCFFYLAENVEEIISPGKSHGTRKTGKVINEFAFPITVVNSKWNVTSIRTEGFNVRGHFRIQPCGKGRSEYEVIFIDPFVKHGYTRKAGKAAA